MTQESEKRKSDYQGDLFAPCRMIICPAANLTRGKCGILMAAVRAADKTRFGGRAGQRET